MTDADPEISPGANPDVIVIGGALSGASTALLLKRRNPRLHIRILERSLKFKRRVGESTVEISSYFLGRVLDLNLHLHEQHLTKQGLRFWFYNSAAGSFDQCSETGPGYNVRLPGYQVDRAVLDEEVLARAVDAGIELWRGVQVIEVALNEGGIQEVKWRNEAEGTVGSMHSRWIVDASGVAALLARRNGWLKANTAHPIASAWSRWRGVAHWDSSALAEKFPAWAARAKGWRFNATNHFVGRGWWAWFIPLKGGDVSVGAVFDQRLVDLPDGPNLGERLRSLLMQHPMAGEILGQATYQEGDVHLRRDLAYRSERFSGDGFVLVGDAAGFMDPFYSPGMDWISFSASSAAALIDQCTRGRPKAERIARHNAYFNTSYERWFDALYRNKYYYMGDFELMTLAFRLDLALYYLGVVSQVFKRGATALETPAFAGPYTAMPYRLISFYNRRLSAIARSRMKRGTWGRHNDRHSFTVRSYELTWRLPFRVVGLGSIYIGLELREGWRSWFKAT